MRFARALWAPLAVVAVHAGMTAAMGHQRQWDPAFHVLGGLAVGYALIQALASLAGRVPGVVRRMPAVAVVAAIAGVAALWELGEFASDRLLGTHVQTSAADTRLDLALGVLGGAIAAMVWAGVSHRRRNARAE